MFCLGSAAQMCLAIPDDQKKQPAIGFPPGWTFYFTNADSVQPTPLARLVLVSPKNLLLRSVDSAINRHKKILSFGPTLKRLFHAHIGILPSGENYSSPVPNQHQPQQQQQQGESSSSKKRRKVAGTAQPKNLSSTKNVGSRVYCKFTNGAYYWGHIVQKRFSRTGTYYAVQFDDGDFLDDIADTPDAAIEGNIYSEVGYYNSIRALPRKESSSSPPAPPPAQQQQQQRSPGSRFYKRATKES